MSIFANPNEKIESRDCEIYNQGELSCGEVMYVLYISFAYVCFRLEYEPTYWNP
jgi:hypothetical protein